MADKSLWRDADFMRLWLAQLISLCGSAVTALAIPLIAVLYLDVSATEMGILTAAPFAPFLIFGLFAGVWIDRYPKRAILIAADIGRGLLLLSVPLLLYLKLMRIEYLVAVQFLAGTLTLLSDIANQSYLPSLVERERLLEGNGKLEMARSTAFVAGPSLAGGLISVASASVAVIFNIFSFFASAILIIRIRKREQIAAERRPQTTV